MNNSNTNPETDSEGQKTGSTWKDLESKIGPNVQWDWKGWLPRGFVVIVAGESGIGKSSFVLRLAASYLSGENWPDGTPYQGDIGNVIWCESESSQSLNFQRAVNWRIPLERIHSPLDDPLDGFSLGNREHFKSLLSAIGQYKARLVVIDSLRGSHNGDENDSKIYHVLKSLSALARDHSIVIIVVHHIKKKSLADGNEFTLDRVRGSTAIVQAARVVIGLDKPNPFSEVLRLSVLKSNVAPKPESIGFRITENGFQFTESPQRPEKATQLDKAQTFLLEVLRTGPMEEQTLMERAESIGLKKRTLDKAKSLLAIKSSRVGGRDGSWHWSLPAKQ